MQPVEAMASGAEPAETDAAPVAPAEPQLYIEARIARKIFGKTLPVWPGVRFSPCHVSCSSMLLMAGSAPACPPAEVVGMTTSCSRGLHADDAAIACKSLTSTEMAMAPGGLKPSCHSMQGAAEQALDAFVEGADVATYRPEIKQSTVVGYIAAAAAEDPGFVNFARLAKEAGLTYHTAAAIAAGELVLSAMTRASLR